jgi:hypothetical protein
MELFFHLPENLLKADEGGTDWVAPLDRPLLTKNHGSVNIYTTKFEMNIMCRFSKYLD